MMIINTNLESLQASVNNEVTTTIDKLETATQTQLQDIKLLKETKILSMKRELERLKAKLGESHPRVLVLAIRLKEYEISVTMVDEAILRSQIPAPEVNKRTWVVNGVVLDEQGQPMINKMIAFTGEDKKIVESIEPVKTDSNGYYEISVPLTDDDMTKMEKFVKANIAKKIRTAAGMELPDTVVENWTLKDKALHLTVMEKDKTLIERIDSPLLFRPGTLDTHKVIVGLKPVTKKTISKASIATSKSEDVTTTVTSVPATNRATNTGTVINTIDNIRKKVVKKPGSSTTDRKANNVTKKVVRQAAVNQPTIKKVAKKSSNNTVKKAVKKTVKKTNRTNRGK